MGAAEVTAAGRAGPLAAFPVDTCKRGSHSFLSLSLPESRQGSGCREPGSLSARVEQNQAMHRHCRHSSQQALSERPLPAQRPNTQQVCAD